MSLNQNPESKKTYWHHQFESTISREQILFDIAVGIGLPAFCLLMDPIVFRQTMFGATEFSPFALWGYTTIGLSFASLVTWLTIRQPAAFLAGL